MKRSQIKRRPMVDAVLESLEPEKKDYLVKDSRNLYFRVKASGAKSWVLRYKKANGAWTWKGLGGYPGISGKRAREQSRKLLRRLADGYPLEQEGIKAITVTELGDQFMEYLLSKQKSAHTIRNLLTVKKCVDADIGKMQVTVVTHTDCYRVVQNTEKRGAHAVAKKTAQFLNRIFIFAIARGYCTHNPAVGHKYFFSDTATTNHQPFLFESELPPVLRIIADRKKNNEIWALLDILMRLLARPTMVRKMQWDELDLEEGIWTVPAHKMKSRREYITPLPAQVMETLSRYDRSTLYIFPGRKGSNSSIAASTLSETLNKPHKEGKLSHKIVPHGFRHTGSTILREHGWDRPLVESQLAHSEGGVAAIYNKAAYLLKRREMLQWYSDHLDSLLD